jgi:mannose-6-phosphate isomerase-like protein (cupin superfamily)
MARREEDHMRRLTLIIMGALATSTVVGAALLAQTALKPGHDRVPPYREPSPFMSRAEITSALDQLDPNLVRSRTGGAVDVAKGKAPGVVRRRMRGPQYAITHTRTLEYMIVTKGTGTLITGGTLIPPTIDSDPYPNVNPNATIRSEAGVKDGLARKIGPGDVIVNRPGTPHWFSAIEEAIEYVEIQIPDVDPAPGVERAEVKP